MSELEVLVIICSTCVVGLFLGWCYRVGKGDI